MGWRCGGCCADSGFDPNEDPVIIGADSEITDFTDTATPDNPTPFPGNVVIGESAGYVLNPPDDPQDGTTVIGANADANAGRATVLGSGAQVFAGAIGGIAIGAGIDKFNPGPTSFGPQDIAIGTDASAQGSGPGPSAIAIGPGTEAIGDGPIAIGSAANAGEQAIAIGWGATSRGQPDTGGIAIGTGANNNNPEGGIAIGFDADVSNDSDQGVAIGNNAKAHGTSNVAVGGGATTAGHAMAAAFGFNAVCDHNFQVMLGAAGSGIFTETDLGYVVTDTDGSGNRWIVQVTAGVLTLNPAP